MFRYKMLHFFKHQDFDKQIEQKNKELDSLRSRLKADEDDLLYHSYDIGLKMDLTPVDPWEWAEHRDFLFGLREKTLEKIKTAETELKKLNQLQDASNKLKQTEQNNAAKDPSSDLFKLKFKIK